MKMRYYPDEDIDIGRKSNVKLDELGFGIPDSFRELLESRLHALLGRIHIQNTRYDNETPYVQHLMDVSKHIGSIFDDTAWLSKLIAFSHELLDRDVGGTLKQRIDYVVESLSFTTDPLGFDDAMKTFLKALSEIVPLRDSGRDAQKIKKQMALVNSDSHPLTVAIFLLDWMEPAEFYRLSNPTRSEKALKNCQQLLAKTDSIQNPEIVAVCDWFKDRFEKKQAKEELVEKQQETVDPNMAMLKELRPEWFRNT